MARAKDQMGNYVQNALGKAIWSLTRTDSVFMIKASVKDTGLSSPIWDSKAHVLLNMNRVLLIISIVIYGMVVFFE